MKNGTNQTAMQELIERLKRNIEEMTNEKNSFTQGYKAGLSFVIECAINSLEKEKEQIVEAYLTGADYTNDEEVILANEYYNETYN